MLLTSISFAMAAQGPYISAQLGAGFLQDIDMSEPGITATVESDPGLALGVAAGYNFGMFRLEGEIGYQKNDFDKVRICAGGLCASGSATGDITNTYFLVNGYFDFVNSTRFTPYISAGIGMAKIEVNDFSVLGVRIGSEDDTVFAYQVGVGVGFAVTGNVTIDLKYRYFATDDPDFAGTKAEYKTHNVYLGLRYTF